MKLIWIKVIIAKPFVDSYEINVKMLFGQLQAFPVKLICKSQAIVAVEVSVKAGTPKKV